MPAPSNPPLGRLRGVLLHAWWLAPLAAALFLVWINQARIARIDYLTNLPGWSARAPLPDPASPTGYEGGLRRLIVPGAHTPSYAWIAETQQTLAEGRWRLREVDFDNAPEGRATYSTAPYRWYLASLAWADHMLSSRSQAQSVENAARYADPLLHGVLLLSAAVFAGLRFGPLSAAVASFASVALFPLAANFQAGAPDGHALAWLFGLWSILPLLAALQAGHSEPVRSGRWGNLLAGIFTGLTLWTDAGVGLLIASGLALGAATAGFACERDRAAALTKGGVSWRSWGLAAAGVVLLGSAVEFFPGHWEWSIKAVHPWHALALLGAGELGARAWDWRLGGRAAWNTKTMALATLATLAVVALPVAGALGGSGIGRASDPFARQLANHPAGVFARDLGAWIARDGFSTSLWATLLPALILLAAALLAVLPRLPSVQRIPLALAIGPALVAAFSALQQLRDWNLLGLAVIPVLIALFSGPAPAGAVLWKRWLGAAGCGILLWPGFLLAAQREADAARPLEGLDIQSILERDLAYRLSHRSGPEGAIVFATPAVSEALAYYGALRGLASYHPENEAGYGVASRIAGAPNWTEASILLSSREVDYIVLPSWDPALEDLIRLGRAAPPPQPLPSDTLVAGILRWDIPLWMRPIPYAVPQTLGMEEYAAVVVAVEVEQSQTLALVRLAEYFLESGMSSEAAATRKELALYPRDLAALTMRAHLSRAARDFADYAAALEALLPYLDRRAARALPLDRRVSLAALLLQAKRLDEARKQMELVLAELDLPAFRALSPSARAAVFAMAQRLDLELPESTQRLNLQRLLPPQAAEQLGLQD